MATGKIIFKATLLIAFFKLISMLLGVARDAVTARLFGVSDLMDAYIMALKIPNTVFYIVSGALVTVVIPVFTEYTARGEKKEAWKVFNTVMVEVMVFFLAASALGMAVAPFLVHLVAPGFSGSKEVLTAGLTMLVLPLMLFTGIHSLFYNLLNANGIFGLPAFSNSVNNIVIIFSALTLGKLYGIHGLALGTVLAAAAMALVQLPALLKTGFRLKFSIDLRHPGVKKIYALALPSALGISVNQANVYVTGILASWLPGGSIAALGFAEKLVQFPVNLFVLALGTAAFPTLSRQASDDRNAFSETLTGALKAIIIGIIPAGAGMMVLSHPLVSLIYMGGAFDQKAVDMTAVALLFFAVGLVGQATGILLTRGFYSLQDTRTPVLISVVTVLVNLGLSLILSKYLQHGGLALANSLASLTYMTLLLVVLGKRVPGLRRGGLLKFTLLVLAASLLMAAASYVVSGALEGRIPGTAGRLVQIGASVAVGVFVYLAAIFALRVEEVRTLWQVFKGILSGRPRSPAGK